MEVNTPLIEAKALKKYFKLGENRYLHAVDNINLQIYKGTTVGIVGESGCGKSTFGRTLLRLTEATSGEILYCGENILTFGRQKMKQMRKNMQIIFQDPYASVDPRKSVVEIIAEYMLIHHTYPTRREIFNRAAQLMDIVGLARRTANSYPHELDGGRRQRIGIARALSLNPQFIVCDEPVSALDVSIQAQILNLMQDLQEQYGLTYIFITHDLSVVKHISDEIMVMYLGCTVERSSAKALFQQPLHPYTKGLLSAIPRPVIHESKNDDDFLTGELSSPINPKPGCRFAPRCRFATEECFHKQPILKEFVPGHLVACHRIGSDIV